MSKIFKPDNFKISELVHPDTLAKYGEARCWEFLDPMLIRNLQWIREQLGKSIKVNDGGQFKNRGLDPKKAYGGYRTGMSQHVFGRGIDFDVKGMTAVEVREWLEENYQDLPEPNITLEYTLKGKPISWVHMDIRPRAEGDDGIRELHI